MTRRRKALGAGLTSAIGGALVTFEQQIFRGRPTVEERYSRRDEVTITSTEGGRLAIGLPEIGSPGPAEPVSRPSPRAKSPG